MRFTNKVCLISGAGSGIGRATAIQFAKEEGLVVVIDRDEKGGNETVDIITKANGKEVKDVDELRSIIGTDKQVTIEGIYPGYNEPFEYPLVLDDGE